MVSSYHCLLLSLRSIDVCDGHRPLNDATVTSLAESIKRLGLLQPISVRARGNGRYTLISGRHRLEAEMRLGSRMIRANVVEVSDVDARLWEISENLHRAELSVGERADQIAEWIRLTEPAPTESSNDQGGQVDQPDRRYEQRGVSLAARTLPVAGNSEEARRLNVRRAVLIAGIAPEAREAAREAGRQSICISPGRRRLGRVRDVREAARLALPAESTD